MGVVRIVVAFCALNSFTVASTEFVKCVPFVRFILSFVRPEFRNAIPNSHLQDRLMVNSTALKSHSFAFQ